MIKKIVYIIGLVFFSSIFLSLNSLAQEYEFNKLFINEQLINNIDDLDWVTEQSNILIKNINEENILEFIIDPNQRIVDVTYSAFQLNIMIDERPCPANEIQLRDKIKKFKIKLLKEEKESVSLDVVYKNKVEVGVTDFLLVPFVIKLLIKEPLQCIFGNRSTITICRGLN